MKKKILISSIVVIALCLCLVAGSTFALFTFSTDVNIVVKSANVDVSAMVDSTTISGTSLGVPATEVDGVLTFANGGTATLNNNAELAIDKLTPGDFVNFTIKGTNESNIPIKYRYVVKFTEGSNLSNVITVKVNGEACTLSSDSTYFTSAWTTPAETGIGDVTISVGMDKDVNGSGYHSQTAKIYVVLEAVQGNGVDDSGNLIQ